MVLTEVGKYRCMRLPYSWEHHSLRGGQGHDYKSSLSQLDSVFLLQRDEGRDTVAGLTRLIFKIY